MTTPTISPRHHEKLPTQSFPPRPSPHHPSAARTPASVGQPLPPSRLHDAHVQDPRTPSPNYFGLTIDHSADCFSSSAAQHARGNWSPPTSHVRSAAAASPKVIPVDQNPEFEAFRRQSETSRFNLGSLADFGLSRPPAPPARQAAHGSGIDRTAANPPFSPALPFPPPRSKVLENSDGVPAPASNRSPKRLLSSDSYIEPERPRRQSPASFTDNETGKFVGDARPLFEEGHSRPSLPATKSNVSNPTHQRSETLPVNLEGHKSGEGATMVTPQHVANLLEASGEEMLLLDLRVSTQYARARITGALNLCIPTTLLKRATFNVRKLAETFSNEEERGKFERWRTSKYIIVYDAESVQLKDATSCVNILKKFIVEGWTGASYIIRGGFNEFSRKFPKLIAYGSNRDAASGSGKPSLNLSGPSVAPVVGGCPLPATQNAANPFFGNIRQNMDLIGGVGQMSIKHPASMNKQDESRLPTWLREAIDGSDHGKRVSDKFLHIEKREQKRMQEALSGRVIYGSAGSAGSDGAKSIQIAGIEKGNKNRYNSIWPYEHSRVKLQGVRDGDCDYVNANHVKAAWSNKRYIATQGPLPSTFTDFWNVVWQQDVRVIVMLTAEEESGQIKAHNYWSQKTYGNLQLNFLSEHRASLEPSRIRRNRGRSLSGDNILSNPTNSPHDGKDAASTTEQPYVIVRKFTLSRSDAPFERMREITQLQYSSWPDFGAPAHPAHLLGLVEQCDAVVRSTYGGKASNPDPPNERPVLVHCSAGCGRTGTFCTVDSVIDMLKRQRQERGKHQTTPMDVDSTKQEQEEHDFFRPSPDSDNSDWIENDKEDLIEKTVEHFRKQRLSMVQSLRQFVLCYESVLEWIVQQQHQQ